MSYVNDLYLPQIRSADACEAAGIDQTTLKNWLSRQPSVVLLTADERKQVEERSRFRFSLVRVLQIAIVAELVRLGILPREAGLFSAAFTDLQDGPLPGRQAREIGQLFPSGRTLMLVYPGRSQADVVNVGHSASFAEVERAGLLAPLDPSSLIIVDLNRIDRRVRVALGFPLTAREDL